MHHTADMGARPQDNTQQSRSSNMSSKLREEILQAHRHRMSSAEIRKINKPLVEKKRRERINTCLDELKSLILDATKRESCRYSKLEKADILEMTVGHLRSMRRSRSIASAANDVGMMYRYNTGFNECASEVTRYLSSMEGVHPEVKGRLLNHLADRARNINASAANSSSGSSAGSSVPGSPFATSSSSSSASPAALQQQLLQVAASPVPSATQLSSMPGYGSFQMPPAQSPAQNFLQMSAVYGNGSFRTSTPCTASDKRHPASATSSANSTSSPSTLTSPVTRFHSSSPASSMMVDSFSHQDHFFSSMDDSSDSDDYRNISSDSDNSDPEDNGNDNETNNNNQPTDQNSNVFGVPNRNLTNATRSSSANVVDNERQADNQAVAAPSNRNDNSDSQDEGPMWRPW